MTRPLSKIIVEKISSIYDDRDAHTIADMLLEHITGKDKLTRLVERSELQLSAHQIKDLEKAIQKLQNGSPIQYVLGYTYFKGLKFKTDFNTLIPRPETEELVEWVCSDIGQNLVSILDIGTGTGCIPISIGKHNPNSLLFAVDHCKGALKTAKENAQANDVPVQFIQSNFLNDTDWDFLPECDIIISNPPYIPEAERAEMDDHVVNFEPWAALFVSNQNPNIFYKRIAEFVKRKHKRPVTVYFETHYKHGTELPSLFQAYGFEDCELRKDIHGQWRLFKAVLRH